MADSMFAKMDPLVKAKMEEAFKSMAAVNLQDLLHDHRPFLVIYNDGHIHRFLGTDTVPSGPDPLTGVDSKDVVIAPETGVFVRLYRPPNLHSEQKVPLLVYFHGGGFCIETAASPAYHLYLNTLSPQANAVIASVDYRLAPEHPLPTAYDDSWFAIDWIAREKDPWLKHHADYSRVFFAGDSAGANIAHHMAKRLGKNPFPKMRLDGVVLIHPFFWGEEQVGSEEANGENKGNASRLWRMVCPKTCGSDDPMINPAKDSDLAEVCAERVLVLVAELDALRDRGILYKVVLEKSGWKGAAEVVETPSENHVFHLMNPSSGNATELMARVVGFINSGSACSD